MSTPYTKAMKKESISVTQQTQPVVHKRFFRRYMPIFLVSLVVVLAISTTYFYKRSVAVKNPDGMSAGETKALIAKINKLALLPSDETPTIATVSDPEKLKDQSFFVDAKVGYKVLVYPNAKKAILYDPESGKIVNMAPVNAGAAK